MGIIINYTLDVKMQILWYLNTLLPLQKLKEITWINTVLHKQLPLC